MVPITLITLLVAAAIGLLTGGRLRAIARLRLTAPALAFAALALAVVASVVTLPRAGSIALLAGSYAFAAAFLIVNRRARGAISAGLAILAIGWSLNATVIALNGGMPLSRAAYDASGQRAPIVEGAGGFERIVIADRDTTLSWLGDVIPVRPLHQVISPGDVALLAGMALMILGAMHLRPLDAGNPDFHRAQKAR